MILPYVYKLTNCNTGQFYFGFRSANNQPSEFDIGVVYFTSSRIVRPIFNEFDVLIVAEFYVADDAWKFEQSLIRTHWGDPLLLNRFVYKEDSKSFNTSGRKRTQEEKDKISKTKTGIKRTDTRSAETTRKMVEGRKWYKPTPETIKKAQDTRRANNSTKHSEETKRKISEATKGRVAYNKGKPLSEEQKKKISDTKRQKRLKLLT